MRKTISLLLATLMLCTLSPLPLHADVQEARNRSHMMANRAMRRNFTFSPTGISGRLFEGEYYNVRITVKKGVDYAILVGGDANSRDIDLYIFDEKGNTWANDTRSPKEGRDVNLEKTATYNGYLDVYIHMRKATGLASFYVLAGRRAKGTGS